MAIALDNIIGTLLNNLVNLLPFRIIHDYEQAVRFTFGHAGPTIRGKERGWCLFVPLFQRVIIVDATWGQVLLDAQTIQTQDKIPLSVSGATIYRISDARSYLLSVFDTDAAAVLRAVAKGVIASVLMAKAYNDIYRDKEGIQEEIVDRFRKEIDGWGVEISKVHLHDLIQTRNIRLHGLNRPMEPENW